jgi:REP element-mobilizing transposase RayT
MHLPHLRPFKKQPLLFITTCTDGRRRRLAQQNSMEIPESIWVKAAAVDGWYVGRYILMPDHVHLFAQASLNAKSLSSWMKCWKSLSACQLAEACQIDPPIWQAGYFDHFVRSSSSYGQKWEYVRENPVRKGLCLQRADWPCQNTLHDLRFF